MRTVVITGGTDGFGLPRWDDLRQRTSSPADARRLYEYTRNVPAERPRSNKRIEVSER